MNWKNFFGLGRKHRNKSSGEDPSVSDTVGGLERSSKDLEKGISQMGALQEVFDRRLDDALARENKLFEDIYRLGGASNRPSDQLRKLKAQSAELRQAIDGSYAVKAQKSVQDSAHKVSPDNFPKSPSLEGRVSRSSERRGGASPSSVFDSLDSAVTDESVSKDTVPELKKPDGDTRRTLFGSLRDGYSRLRQSFYDGVSSFYSRVFSSRGKFEGRIDGKGSFDSEDAFSEELAYQDKVLKRSVSKRSDETIDLETQVRKDYDTALDSLAENEESEVGGDDDVPLSAVGRSGRIRYRIEGFVAGVIVSVATFLLMNDSPKQFDTVPLNRGNYVERTLDHPCIDIKTVSRPSPTPASEIRTYVKGLGASSVIDAEGSAKDIPKLPVDRCSVRVSSKVTLRKGSSIWFEVKQYLIRSGLKNPSNKDILAGVDATAVANGKYSLTDYLRLKDSDKKVSSDKNPNIVPEGGSLKIVLPKGLEDKINKHNGVSVVVPDASHEVLDDYASPIRQVLRLAPQDGVIYVPPSVDESSTSVRSQRVGSLDKLVDGVVEGAILPKESLVHDSRLLLSAASEDYESLVYDLVNDRNDGVTLTKLATKYSSLGGLDGVILALKDYQRRDFGSLDSKPIINRFDRRTSSDALMERIAHDYVHSDKSLAQLSQDYANEFNQSISSSTISKYARLKTGFNSRMEARNGC